MLWIVLLLIKWRGIEIIGPLRKAGTDYTTNKNIGDIQRVTTRGELVGQSKRL